MSIYRHRENRTPSRGGQVEAKQAEENFRKALCRDRFSEKKIGLQETQKKIGYECESNIGSDGFCHCIDNRKHSIRGIID